MADKIVMGIDYSMSCPAACICLNEEEFDFKDCRFLFLTDTKKYQVFYENILVRPVPTYKSDEERFDKISYEFLSFADLHGAKEVSIEGYAYGGSGVVFHIAENTGILKHKLYNKEIPISVYPPSRIKKYATGSGRADKEQMYTAFVKETGVDLKKQLNYEKTKTESPVADIVDAYYICKYHYHHRKEKS